MQRWATVGRLCLVSTIAEHGPKQLIFSREAIDGEVNVSVKVDQTSVDEKAAKEIEKRLQDSNLMFLYNSTTQHDEIYFERGKRRAFFEFVMSPEERKILEQANKGIEKQIRKLAKDHVHGLTEILGKLTDKYDVELSPPQGFTARRMPLGINLRDKSVQVPINDWEAEHRIELISSWLFYVQIE